jgi:hypothetical protein
MKTIFMRKADWQKWDTALRSGEYKQGVDRLKTEHGYCCLGVLEHCLTGEVERDGDGDSYGTPSHTWLCAHNIEFHRSDSQLDVVPYLPSLALCATVANDNDKSFIQIADAIQDCVQFTDED